MKYLLQIILTVFIVFVTLKLIGIISWSWWIISLPILAPIVISILLIVFTYIFHRDQNLM